MQIRLRKIELINFKGIRSLEIQFNQTTNIFGDNAVGKTTLFDAFTWCLFGKDSNDRKDFELKTLDANNKVIPQIEHEVECEIQAEQQVINIRRVLSEKWTKRRGDSATEFTGNETTYFWNDVPLKQREFQDKISGLIDEGLFKLITNPLFFNTNLEWRERRQVLFSLAEPVTNESILDSIATVQNKTQIEAITNMLNMGKSLVEYKKEISAKKKKLKDELESIAPRIDEVRRSMPDVQDWSAIETEIASIQKEIDDVNEKKEDIVKSSQVQNNLILQKQQQKNELKSKLQKLEHELTADRNKELLELQSKLKEVRFSIENHKSNNNRAQDTIISLNNRIAEHEANISNLRLEWGEINSKKLEITDDKTCCPACNQKLPDAEIANITDTLTSNFNEQKQKDLQANNNKGAYIKKEIETDQFHINELNKTILNNSENIQYLESELKEAMSRLEAMSDKQVQPTEEILALRSEIENFVIPESKPADFAHLNLIISSKNEQLNAVKKTLNDRDQIERSEKRVIELQNQEATMSQELADLENTEFAIDAFNKKRIDLMVHSVNNKFKHVKFKLFSDNINGGVEECCDALVNTNGAWVPFQGGNKAGQINAGIDIINTLCEHHGVYAPIFIDNRESVNELISSKSQIINLIVSTDKTLKVQ